MALDLLAGALSYLVELTVELGVRFRYHRERLLQISTWSNLVRDVTRKTLHPGDTEDKKMETINNLKTIFRKFGISRREILGFQGERKGRKGSRWSIHRVLRKLKTELDCCIDELVSCNYLEKIEVEGELEHKVDRDVVINSLHDIKSMEDLVLHNANSSNCFTNDEKSRALLLITAIPALCDLKDCYKMLQFLIELSTELDNLPELICKACEGEPQALLLIGSLLSVNPRAYDTWNRVKDDLVKIKKSVKPWNENYMWHIYTYCYDELSYFLKACFLYLACYPMNYEIPARSLTEIWIAEEFVDPQDGETIEETANKYLEQLVQRSLVWVSKRSISGAVKYCRVRQSIHEFCIKKSCEEECLVANPKEEEMRSLTRVAFYNDDKKQYTGEEFKTSKRYRDITSLVCFDFDMSDLQKIKLYMPEVLELRKSTNTEKTLFAFDSYSYLKYLGLRGSNISKLPNNFGSFIYELITLDIRDTNIDTLPESLWNITTLRHVYVNPSPKIKGPPSTAKINDLQILKTVAVHKSWLENFPQFLSNLRKLALSNRDKPNSKSNPYWKPISNLLSHMVNLLSMEIIGDIVPSEFVDTRALPNLETVKSIKLEGQWRVRKLLIDNIKFPPNLVKLTLIKSGLKEDPMSVLERLQALKYLSLQDGAYIGKKMVCSANGFPQLRFLDLFKLENLEIWEVKPKAMAQLTTVRVVQCLKLENFPNLEHVTDQVI
ncbi:putative disease resistance protein At1g59780 [Carex rostrata]